jgi:predicted ATP-grasp superfamily ATP-dependent carboligase
MVHPNADGGASANDGMPPAILVGASSANAVSVARSLGRRGVVVYLLCGASSESRHSRYARRLNVGAGAEAWARFLLGGQSDWLRGAVLLACSDDAIQMTLEHREALTDKYVLDIAEPAAQWCFLNKLSTYEAAREAGVPTPLFWRADSLADINAHRAEFVYPLMVKPLFSHRFKKVFSGKYFLVRDFDELVAAFEKVHAEGVEVLLLEEIPGDDDRLCSCYTYIDEQGKPAFDFTKRILRRHPERQGFGCYHITDWSPDVLEMGLRLIQHVGHRGIANVEFKRDDRDGRLKVIECNIRFTAANEILIASGYDLPLFVYSRLAGRPFTPLNETQYERGVRLWFPLADFLEFLELHRQGRLTTMVWLRSVFHAQALPYFAWDDPLPSLAVTLRIARLQSIRGARRALQQTRAFTERRARVT